MRRVAHLAALVVVMVGGARASAADLYVSPSGDDAADGSSAHPFLTIGKCASVAAAGDTCWIAPGTYAELVAPANSGTAGNPITFAALDPASPPVLAGTRALTGFSPWQGSIWQAASAGTFTTLFVDRKRMILARDPNLASGDEYRPSFYQATADGGPSAIVDEVHLTQPAGYWDGAKIYMVAGLGWSADQRDVASYDPASHSIGFTPMILFGQFYAADQFSLYYLYDKLELLDAPSEWYLDSSSQTAYLWTPDGSDPNGHLVEVDGPSAGFDLSNAAYVRLERLGIFAGELDLDNAVGCTVEDLRLLYPRAEVHVGGSDNQILRSEIAYADKRCVELGGTRNALKQSHVHHCDAAGQYQELVKLAGPANVIADNLLHDTGRDGIGTVSTGIAGSIVEHNELYNAGLIAKDCGAFYSYETSGGGTVLRYNIVHGVWPAPSLEYGPDVRLGFGIYFDDGCSDYVAHHNVVYGTSGFGIFLHEPSTQITVVNNTAVGLGGGAGEPIGEAPGSGGPDAGGSSVVNNLAVVYDDRPWCIRLDDAVPSYDHNGYFRVTGTNYNSAGVEGSGVVGDPLFLDVDGGNFALAAGSPFIDQGAVVSGLTDGYAGAAPDIGAYELGGSEEPGPRFPVGPAVVDAGSAADAGSTVADAGNTATDAGATAIDAGSSATDAGSGANDGGGTVSAGGPTTSGGRSAVHGGCAAVDGVELLALLVVALLLRRPRP